MALPLSGEITLNDIHIEAGGATGDECTLNDADIRALLSPTPASGSEMDFSDWYGASASTTAQINLEAARGGGGNLSGATFGGLGGNTIIDIEISANRGIYCTAGGHGVDGSASTEGGGGGGFAHVTMGETFFAHSVAIAGGGGGAGYFSQGGNAGRGGPGAGTPSSGGTTIAATSQKSWVLYPGGNGFGEADTVSSSGPSGGSSYPGKGGGGGGTSGGLTGQALGGLGGTGRYAGAAASTASNGQGGWANCVGGRGGEFSAGNSNANGGAGSLGGIGKGGIGGNAVDQSDSGGGGGGGGVNGGGGGSGGAYGSGGGGGGAGYYLTSSSTLLPTSVSSIVRAGGSNGSRNAAGRVRVYREGVLVQTVSGSGSAAGNTAYTILF